MDTTAQFIAYGQTGYFSPMVMDYIAAAKGLQPFYAHPVSMQGITAAMEQRKAFATDRELLVTLLQQQYAQTELSAKQRAHLEILANNNTYTICTAHQPNIFTGHLYFVYKILHAVKLAEELKNKFPENNFVPIYYMGSEDADLDELGHIFIDGKKLQWETAQTGAVGRMKVDKGLLQLIERLSGQLSVDLFGEQIFALVKDCYQQGVTIEQATFKLVNALFADYGLLILLPDNAAVKSTFIAVMERELLEGFAHVAVKETVAQFPAAYKAQASGRAINLFYLLDNQRERIERTGDEFIVVNTTLSFSKDAILEELHQHPERFSPNVILRPVLQETILPNIAFIGGGGELAYWLELKKVFDAVQVPYPMLIVRNSFLFINKSMQALAQKLQFSYAELFKPQQELVHQLVKRDSAAQLSLEAQKLQLAKLYEAMKEISGAIDVTLQTHVDALKAKAMDKINSLEKKMLSAELKKMQAQQRQIAHLKTQLFPNQNLQERVDNLLPFYAAYGKAFIETVYKHSEGLQQEFGIILE